ncbi:unnamed protein product [Prorocentrum cordatum]|uniref:Transketolase N-terminal domain-containing protein n=1 Tax=Prorocentrum cordatum TaxID=2364126 RepID=A0ABN9YHX9_9DINO|nr:unnamed protein product [Polarella glacialis]
MAAAAVPTQHASADGKAASPCVAIQESSLKRGLSAASTEASGGDLQRGLTDVSLGSDVGEAEVPPKRARLELGTFPVDLNQFVLLSIDPWSTERLSSGLKESLRANVQLFRDAVVFFTACGGASGYGGHTGGAFDTAPEACLLDAFFRARPDMFVPTMFDEAGHRVATQYMFSVLRGHMPAEALVKYREGHSNLPGHPELGRTPGIEFSSGRLGHLWGHLNGVSRAQPGKIVCCLGSDGSQMEGNNAEAARFAVANGLSVKLFIDDNDVTISGHPSQYLKGFDLRQTLSGQGVPSEDVDGEDIDALYAAMRRALLAAGPAAVVVKRKMCPGVSGVEGSCEGHDACAKSHALAYLEARGLAEAAKQLQKVPKSTDPYGKYLGAGAFGAPRGQFGTAVCGVLAKLGSAEERRRRVLVVDSDLEGSCGLKGIREKCPEVYVKSGVMERGNFLACAGFGFADSGRQGVFGTFAAFQEMIISEVTMARLNRCNVLCHFPSRSRSATVAPGFGTEARVASATTGCFGLFIYKSPKVVEAVFWDQGLRFIYSTRSKVPEILADDGKPFFGGDYEFHKGKDDVLLKAGPACGYVVSYGDALYRSHDAVLQLRAKGLQVGLVNKCHVNVPDEDLRDALARGQVELRARCRVPEHQDRARRPHGHLAAREGPGS